MKPIRMLVAAAILAALSLTACGRSIQEETEARFKLNPHPKQAYRLKIKINNAPGPLVFITKMGVGYFAENCSYEIDSWAGATAHPEKNMTTEIRKIGENEYESVVYFDAMVDEDYFGDGVCRWKLENFGFSLKPSGKPEETRFNFSDLMKYLVAQKTMTKYYWKRNYPYSRKEDGSIYADPVSFGIVSPELYNAEEHLNMFTITVNFEEVNP